MANLVEECAQLLMCSPQALREHINHPVNRAKIERMLKIRPTTQTCYLDRNGQHKIVHVHGITTKAATNLMAYGRMNAKYNVSVCQHFYARHRVRLLFPQLPCVIEHFPRGEDRFYPLEMLKFPDAPTSNDWLGNMFKEISAGDKKTKEEADKNEKEEEEDVDFARSDCSQKMCTCCDPPTVYSCWFTHPH
jgi:hypothetical protein